MRKVIYYFSGTGNSLRAARIIATETGDIRLVSMRNIPGEVPKVVKLFVEKLAINSNTYIFMVAT